MVYKYPIDKSPIADFLYIVVMTIVAIYVSSKIGFHWFGKLSLVILILGMISSTISLYSGLFIAPQQLIIEGSELIAKYYSGTIERYNIRDLIRIDENKSRWLWRDQFNTKLVFNKNERGILIGKYLIGLDEFTRAIRNQSKYTLSNQFKGNAT